MTIEDARKLIPIAADVDGGCPVCVGCLLFDLEAAFPEIDWALCAAEFVRETEGYGAKSVGEWLERR